MSRAKQRITVIGQGLYGGAATNVLSQFDDVEVTGIDQYPLPHDKGSSTGGTRIARFAKFENRGKGYVHPVIQTARLFTKLQKRPHIKAYIAQKYGSPYLFYPNGFTMMGPSKGFNDEAHGSGDPLNDTIRVAKQHKDIIDFDVVDSGYLRKKFSAFSVMPDEEKDFIAYCERGSGTIFPERCVDALSFDSRKNGARILTGSKVVDMDAHPIVKKVILENGEVIEADSIIICAGPWVNEFMPRDMHDTHIERQVQAWFESEDPDFTIRNYPNYIRLTKNGYFYGFPANDQDPVKIARENGVRIHPSDRELDAVWGQEANRLHDFSAPYIPSLRKSFIRASACRYTVTPDHLYRINLHPEALDTYVVSACSGHGAQASYALMAELAHFITGRPPLEKNIDLKDYGLKRLPAFTV